MEAIIEHSLNTLDQYDFLAQWLTQWRHDFLGFGETDMNILFSVKKICISVVMASILCAFLLV